MKNGIRDFDVAMALSDLDGDPENAALGLALSVAFGQLEGGEFDWSSMSWKKRDG